MGSRFVLFRESSSNYSAWRCFAPDLLCFTYQTLLRPTRRRKAYPRQLSGFLLFFVFFSIGSDASRGSSSSSRDASSYGRGFSEKAAREAEELVLQGSSIPRALNSTHVLRIYKRRRRESEECKCSSARVLVECRLFFLGSQARFQLARIRMSRNKGFCSTKKLKSSASARNIACR